MGVMEMCGLLSASQLIDLIFSCLSWCALLFHCHRSNMVACCLIMWSSKINFISWPHYETQKGKRHRIPILIKCGAFSSAERIKATINSLLGRLNSSSFFYSHPSYCTQVISTLTFHHCFITNSPCVPLLYSIPFPSLIFALDLYSFFLSTSFPLFPFLFLFPFSPSSWYR